MNISFRRFVRTITFLLAAGLLAACLPGLPGLPGESAETPTPTPTFGLAGGDAAFGLLHYEYRIDGGAAYSMSIVQDIPFDIWVDPAEPKEATIITGSAQGVETVTIQALDQGVLCTVTITFVVKYNITGIFTPKDFCKVVLNVDGKSVPEQISTTTTCSHMPPGFDPAGLFITPYNGLFEFVMPYRSITVHPYSPENTVTTELLQLVTPVSTDCTHNP